MQRRQRRLEGICRACCERYDPSIGSVGIYEDRGPGKQPYYIILRDHVLEYHDLFPGDQMPDRLGLTCAKLLDDFDELRQGLFETQNMFEKEAAQLKADKEAALEDQTSSSNQPSTSGVPPNSSSDCSEKQSDSTDSSESDEDDKFENKKLKMSKF